MSQLSELEHAKILFCRNGPLTPSATETVRSPITADINCRPPANIQGFGTQVPSPFLYLFYWSGYLGKDSYTEDFVDDLELQWLE